jgi:exodeoxyribonuclease VII large subunit
MLKALHSGNIAKQMESKLNSSSQQEQRIIEKAISVFEINQLAGEILDVNFNNIAIRGEISNLSKPRSGHIYFTLKDDRAQVRCALFRQHTYKMAAPPEDGDEVVVTATVSIYSARGDYQLIVNNIFAVGDGQLQAIFQQRLKKLKHQGLFSLEHKKPIPKNPNCIGIVTSATGAALQDILKVLKRRAAGITIKIFPATVQGESAAQSLYSALKHADTCDCDTIILGRGGGSAEDLWAFNDEKLAHLIFACKTPIITGIGHEVDTSIADFVADLRAATPSAAAECASQDMLIHARQLADLYSRAKNAIAAVVKNNILVLDNLHWQLQQVSPVNKIDKMHYQLQNLTPRLTPALKNNLARSTQNLNSLAQKLEPAIKCIADKQQHNFALLCSALNNLSPLQVLGRGYAMAEKDGKILQQKSDFKPNMPFNLQIQDAIIKCRTDD